MSKIEKLRASIELKRDYSIIRADEGIYAYLGELSKGLFTRAVHQDDIKKLENMVGHVSADTPLYECIRISNAEGEYTWFMVEAFEDGGDVKLLITDIYAGYEAADKLRKEKAVLEGYLSVMDQLMFNYNPEDDLFVIYKQTAPGQLCILYEGTLDNYRRHLLNNKVLTKKHIATIEKAYTSIKELRGMNNQNLESVFEHYSDQVLKGLINSKVVADEGGKERLIGFISVLRTKADQAAASVMTFGRKDSGTDLYDKKTIVNYTKQLMSPDIDDHVSIAIIDLDDFKGINDTYGHAFGDEVLRDAAHILQEAVGAKGMCGRIGGDEMFIVFRNDGSEEDVRSVLRTIKCDIGYLYQSDSRNIRKISCSIGSAMYPDDADNYEDLFNIADKMLYLAKEKGKNRYIYYQPAIHKQYLESDGTKDVEKNSIAAVGTRYHKVSLMTGFANEYANSEPEKKKAFITDLAEAFFFDSIFVYDLKQHSRKVIFGECSVEENGEFLLADNLLPSFREDRIMPVNSILHFERRCPMLPETFKPMEIEQMVMYKTYEEPVIDGYVISYNRNKMQKQWAEMDLMQLGILGSIILNEENLKDL